MKINIKILINGPSPIDFDEKLDNKMCVYNELCNFNIKKL